MPERGLAAFAIENDVLHWAFAAGGLAINPPQSANWPSFEYTGFSQITTRPLSDVLTEDVLQQVVRDALAMAPVRVDAIGFSIYGAVNCKTGVRLSSPSDAQSHRNPLDFPVADIIRTVAGEGTRVWIDNDANAAALGERLWGVGRGLEQDDVFGYLWVSRGINAACVYDVSLLKGNVRPETGHLLARRHPTDGYPGNCETHNDCITGLAGLHALRDRLKNGASQSEALDYLGYYVAQLCATLTLTGAPVRIALGGMQMREKFGDALLTSVRKHYPAFVSGFPHEGDESAARRIVAAELDMRGCLLGVAELARRVIDPHVTFRGART